MELMKILINDESGQGLVEYALIVGLIALVAVGAITLAGGSVSEIWDKISDRLGTANDAIPNDAIPAE